MSEKRPPYRVLRAILEHPWAMHPPVFDLMLEIVERRISGEMLSSTEKQARLEAARRTPAPGNAPGTIAVLNLYGVMAQRVGAFEDISQEGTAAEDYGNAFRQAVRDPNIAAVVLNVDSPGGSVFGIQELADLIWSSRGQKPIIAVANSMAASAAYFVASQADELVVTPGGEVGSIGIIARHDDASKMAEMKGVKVTYVTAPEGGYKSEGNPFEPLTDEGRAHLQETANAYYDKFVRAVSRGRKTSLTRVREDFGKGRMYTAERAVTLGMADRIATLQEVIDGLISKQGRNGARAEGGITLTAGPKEAPMLREGSKEKSCENCSYMSKPSEGGDRGTCTRHNFTTEAAWVCDDHEMMMDKGEGMEDGEMRKQRAIAKLRLAGAGRAA